MGLIYGVHILKNKKLFFYIIKRLLLILLSLIGVLSINFLLLNILNINPFYDTLNSIIYNNQNNPNQLSVFPNVSQGLIDDMNSYFHLNDDIYNKFIFTIKRYLSFDLGTSFYNNNDVLSLIIDKIRASLIISLYSTLGVYIFSVLIAYLSMKTFGFVNFIIYLILLILYIIPTFWISNILISIFHGYYITLAIISNGLGGLWLHSIFIKNLMETEKSKLYHKFLSFNNQKPKMLKNILLICLIDLPSILLAMLFSSSLIVEIIFDIHGIGYLMYISFIYKDYPVILGIIFLTSLIGLVIRLLNDIIYSIVDKQSKIY